MLDISILRADKQALLTELRIAGADIAHEGREIRCPFHDDKHASAGIYEEAGVWRYKCLACNTGGDVIDIIAITSKRSAADVLKDMAARERPTHHAPAVKVAEKKTAVYATTEKLAEAVAWTAQGGKIAHAYVYANPDTKNADMIVYRIEYPDGRKTFRQAHQTPDGYVMKAPAGLLPLYNRARVVGAAAVVVVEGEKCVHCLHGIGIVATTSPGGAGKAALCDWAPLAGKTAYLWPDCDAPDPKTGKRTGIEHMRQVAAELEKLVPAADVRWIDCDQLGLPKKGDVVDYLATSEGTTDQKRLAIQAVLEFAESLGPAKEIRAEVEAAIAGKRNPVAFPWSAVSRSTRALLPGTLTILCGPPGSTKSLWLLQALAWWHDRGERVAVLELEETRVYHLMRAVAQRSGVSKMTNAEWHQENPIDARKIITEQESFSNAFGRRIYAAPTGAITPESIIEWMRDRAAERCRIMAIDPITAMDGGEKTWTADHKVVIAAHQIAAENNASVILVTHPRKGQPNKSGSGMDDMAGGATYQRFSQTVLWLDNLKESKSGSFTVSTGTTSDDYNRILHVMKARNSWGQWKRIGFNFDAATFRSRECGVLEADE